jgi:uncharacterized repeat protein (TIGR02543 family)
MNTYVIQYNTQNNVNMNDYPSFTPTTPSSVTIKPTDTNTTVTLAEITPTDVFFNGWYFDNELSPSYQVGNTLSIEDILTNSLVNVTNNADGSQTLTLTLYGEYYSGYTVSMFINDDTVKEQLKNTTTDGLYYTAKTILDPETDLLTISANDFNRLYNATYENSNVAKIFVGWYLDENLTTEFVVGTEITESMSLYAKWTETGKFKLEFDTTVPTDDTNLTKVDIAPVYLI